MKSWTIRQLEFGKVEFGISNYRISKHIFGCLLGNFNEFKLGISMLVHIIVFRKGIADVIKLNSGMIDLKYSNVEC